MSSRFLPSRVEVQPIAALAGNAIAKSQELAVAGYDSALVLIDHAPNTESAPGGGTGYLIQGSELPSTDEDWRTLASHTTGTAAAAAEALAGAEAAGSTVLEVASTTGFALSDEAFILETTVADSEWIKVVKFVADTSLTILDGLTRPHSGKTIYNKAEHFVDRIDVRGLKRLRVVANNNIHATSYLLAWRAAVLLSRNG